MHMCGMLQYSVYGTRDAAQNWEEYSWNRVTKWGRDGITIEADHRHVRETLKDLELEQSNHAATSCNMDKKTEKNATSDGSKGENQCEQGQRHTRNDWDDAGGGDDKNRV